MPFSQTIGNAIDFNFFCKEESKKNKQSNFETINISKPGGTYWAISDILMLKVVIIIVLLVPKKDNPLTIIKTFDQVWKYMSNFYWLIKKLSIIT